MSAEAPTPSAPALSMSDFFTRQRANAGIELPLDLPDGTPSGHTIRIRGVDSDQFRAAKADSSRRLMELVLQREKTSPDAVDFVGEQLRMIAALVIGWSFAEPCTPENVLKLLQEAPHLADEIDRIASKRSLFFANGSPNSTPSPKQNSS